MENNVDIVLFDEEEITKTIVESYLSEITFNYNFYYFNSLDKELIPQKDNSKIVIVNINKTISENLNILESISKADNTVLIVISYDKTTDIQVKSFRNGAENFLFKPLIKSDFLNCLETIYYNKIYKRGKNMSSKIYSIVSVDKGTGKTFFALNLSEQLALLSEQAVLLVDFNNSLTDVFSLLNINVRYNVVEYVNNLTEENAEQMLSKLLKNKKVPFYILGTGMHSSFGNKINIEKISNFFNILKKYFKYIIIDNDSSLGKLDEVIRNNSDYTYVITEPSIAMAEKLELSTYSLNLKSDRVRIILNKYNSKKDEAVIPELELHFGKSIFCKLPKNYVACNSSITRGVTIEEINPELDIVKAYEQLAKNMIERDK